MKNRKIRLWNTEGFTKAKILDKKTLSRTSREWEQKLTVWKAHLCVWRIRAPNFYLQ